MSTNSKPTFVIRFADESDNTRLTEFRISQLNTAKEFVLLKPELLSKQSGYIFLVEENKKIISTMQVEPVKTPSHFEEVSGSHFLSQFDADIFPGLYLSKAGTSKDLRNSGINSYLRLLTIENAVSDISIISLTGIGYENAPRLNLLKRIGYKFLEVKMPKDGYTLPLSKPIFLHLQRSLFEIAIQRLTEETSDLVNEYNVEIQMDKQSTWV